MTELEWADVHMQLNYLLGQCLQLQNPDHPESLVADLQLIKRACQLHQVIKCVDHVSANK